MHAAWLALGLLLAPGAYAAPQNAPASAASIADLPMMTVTGVQPGPGLWKVSRGDHVMYILGISSPLPEKIQWQSAKVEQAVAGSQVLLESPRPKFKADLGFFGKLFLLPSIWSARKNEDGRTLQQIVSPSDYALWLSLKAKYLGNDSGIERWRPIFAALKLAKNALDKAGLSTTGGVVTDKVRDMAKQHGVPVVPVLYTVEVKDPRGALKAFKQAGPNDLECFHRTMLALAYQLPVIVERANAWATGDIDTLRNSQIDDPREACKDAITEAGFARQVGMADLPVRLKSAWLRAALGALKQNRQSFAILPMNEVLPYNGYLAVLQSNGYTVAPPPSLPADDDNDPATASTAATPLFIGPAGAASSAIR